MPTRTELNLRIPNSPGALEGVCRLLSNERVNVLAMSLDGSGQLRMVVDNHVHAGATLREHHHEVAEREVIVLALPNTPGGLAAVLRLIADAGVNLDYVYGGAADGSQTASVVVGVEDPARAAAAAGV